MVVSRGMGIFDSANCKAQRPSWNGSSIEEGEEKCTATGQNDADRSEKICELLSKLTGHGWSVEGQHVNAHTTKKEEARRNDS